MSVLEIPAQRIRPATGTAAHATGVELRAVQEPEPESEPGRPGALGYVLIALGVALIPWLFVLATSLPDSAQASHWSTAWVGLDALEAIGLIGTGVLVRRRDHRLGVAAAATAMLLVVDAWFDVSTAAPGADIASALLMAALLELPLAALCAVLAVRASGRANAGGAG